jgi:phosphatidylethanolamine/phosphatidyl-N-methylethanolamine N-methyltransferase
MNLDEVCIDLGLPLMEFSFLDYLKNPREIGVDASSSPALGDAMASMIPNNGRRFVVELGPGDGALTRRIVASGIPDRDLILIELEKKFIPLLEKEFPNATVINGSATDLSKIISKYAKNDDVRAIVSGLPLRSLPVEVTKDTITQVIQALKTINGCKYIQFTYDPRGTPSYLNRILDAAKDLILVDRKHVLRNIPPAYAECIGV